MSSHHFAHHCSLSRGRKRGLRKGNRPERVPLPSSLRVLKSKAKWRTRLWEAKHKHFILMGPQYRELFRKMAFSIRRAGLSHMKFNLWLGVFWVWFYTGKIEKTMEFIEKLFSGTIFLMNGELFLPKNTTGQSKIDIYLKRLLYNPNIHAYGNGLTENQILAANSFSEFLGPPPDARPWIQEWESGIAAVIEQMTRELGAKQADEIINNSPVNETNGKKSDTSNSDSKPKAKAAYW